MEKAVGERGTFILGDMQLIWRKSGEGKMGVTLRPFPNDDRWEPAKEIDSCLQFKLFGDDFPSGFSNGHTMRNAQSVERIVSKKWRCHQDGRDTVLVLDAEMEGALKIKQEYRHKKETQAVEVCTIYHNCGKEPKILEMAASFSLEGISVPQREGACRIYRMRSCWSSEGRIQEDSLEELQLEPSWSGYGVRVEKFGQIGSMPVRKYFPFLAVENREQGIAWGMKVCCSSSWQMEIYRRGQDLCVSGGLADEDFGHWKKRLEPGECFATPKVYLTVCKGGMEEVARRLLSLEKKGGFQETLPVIFNEFCTSWGKPSEKAIELELDALKGHNIDYFVIDAGWYGNERLDWEANMGDWIPNKKLFPNGLTKAVEKIRNAGKKPGIWFEIEIVGKEAKIAAMSNHLLKRNGQVITTGNRRFWDMTDTWTMRYLDEKVIGFLKKYQFSYLKIDYNDSIGIGCDGAESLGEGLRRQIQASQRFFQTIKKELPELKLEICSSGGHRLESTMMDLGDFLSFSDAHEELEIPVIAANLHRAVLPEKSEIWAVLRKTDGKKRLEYSLINTFLGVMCLSGDILELTEEQWECVDQGIAFYKKISPVLIQGDSHIQQNIGLSYRNLSGWQTVIRYGEGRTLVVFHRFRDKKTEYSISISGTYRKMEKFGHYAEVSFEQEGELKIFCEEEFAAVAILLTK